MGTLFLYFRARSSGAFVAFVDLLFVGAFIAAVYQLRGITDVSCGNFDSNNSVWLNLGPFGYVGAQTNDGLADNPRKNCSMLKASFAFGIMNTIFFFFTFVSFLRWGTKTCCSQISSSSRSGLDTTTDQSTTVTIAAIAL